MTLAAEVTMVVSPSWYISFVLFSETCMSCIHPWDGCGMFGMDGHGSFCRQPHFSSVSAVHHLYCCLSFPYSLLPCIPQGSLDVLWHDGYLFSMDCVEVGWHHFQLCTPILFSFSSFVKATWMSCGMIVIHLACMA